VLRITAAPTADGQMWQFCVEDNGIGIPPEFAEKVFVIFQRLHGRDAYPGTGIGLALCKRIVEHHGGEIRLDEAYTGGTRICFTLPRIAPAGTDEAGRSEQPGQAERSPDDTAAARAGDSSAEGIPA
jgi:signal transduction histidine kinase